MEKGPEYYREKRQRKQAPLGARETAISGKGDPKSPRRHLETQLYSNCIMLGPKGNQMCHLPLKRAYWYLNRGLATRVKEEPLTIQLNFEPNGDGGGSDPFYSLQRQNICVVCGKEEELTRHHCIPFCFRRHFPPEYKENASHDILLLCAECHESYERQAQLMKEELLKQAGVKVGFGSDLELLRMARKAAATLYHRGESIPEENRQRLKELIESVYGCPATDDLIIQALLEEEAKVGVHGTEMPDPWRIVCQQIEDLHGFNRSWREHFLTTMNPRHLPEHWSVEGRYQK